MRMKHALAITAAATVAVAGVARAGSLENMERERAHMLQTLLDPSLEAAERQEKVANIKHRLVDLERMVLRDDDLRGKNTPVVRTAFKDYDRTFLVHAAVEAETTILDHWLKQVGVSSHAVRNV